LGLLQALADLAAEVVVEPELRPGVTLGIDSLVVPLHESLRIREGAVLLDVRRRGHEEDLGRDLLGRQLTALDLGRVVPEGRRLDLDEVADDEPVERRQPLTVQLRVRGPDRGGLPGYESRL